VSRKKYSTLCLFCALYARQFAFGTPVTVQDAVSPAEANSPMLPDLKRDDDGGVTLYIQHDSPGKDKESNWLPAPSGQFLMFLRLFWPKPEALDGKWKQPPLQRAE